MIGNFGNFEFEVSEGNVKTFQELNFTKSAAFTEHKIINSHPLLEFTGFNSSSATLKIILDADFGLNPEQELQVLHDMLESHEAEALILNGIVQGGDLWVIEDLSENLVRVGSRGEVLRAEVNLTLKEYFS